MSHNTYDIVPYGEKYMAISHNFPECAGEGLTESEAVEDLSRKVTYLVDNQPKEFIKRVKARIKRGLECECGEKLKEKPMGVYLNKKDKRVSRAFRGF